MSNHLDDFLENLGDNIENLKGSWLSIIVN